MGECMQKEEAARQALHAEQQAAQDRFMELQRKAQEDAERCAVRKDLLEL